MTDHRLVVFEFEGWKVFMVSNSYTMQYPYEPSCSCGGRLISDSIDSEPAPGFIGISCMSCDKAMTTKAFKMLAAFIRLMYSTRFPDKQL